MKTYKPKSATKTEVAPFDVYQMVTDKILKNIEESGKLTWVKPWKCHHTNGGNFPMNGKTKHRYEGVNFFLLQFSGYTSPYWLTFKQVEEMKGSVKKGEKSTQIVFWKINRYSDVEPETGKEKVKNVPMLRYYNVFNVEQCEGINIETPAVPASPYNDNTPIELSETVINQYGQLQPSLKIEVRESERAFYMPSADRVNMPTIEQFNSSEEYYSTFFHELSHSTGHETRLNRKEVVSTSYFGSSDYGYEELTAELTASFICADIGLTNESQERNSIAYLKIWMNAIKADKKLFVLAAGRAAKAARYILNKPDNIEDGE